MTTDPTQKRPLVEAGLLSVAEAAAFLSISRSTLYDLMERGELRYVKIGRSRRIPKHEIVNLAARNLKGGWGLEVPS